MALPRQHYTKTQELMPEKRHSLFPTNLPTSECFSLEGPSCWETQPVNLLAAAANERFHLAFPKIINLKSLGIREELELIRNPIP